MSEHNQTATETEYLTVPALAREWDSGTRPIYRLIRAGELRAFAINERGDLRIPRQAVREFVDRRSAAVRF